MGVTKMGLLNEQQNEKMKDAYQDGGCLESRRDRDKFLRALENDIWSDFKNWKSKPENKFNAGNIEEIEEITRLCEEREIGEEKIKSALEQVGQKTKKLRSDLVRTSNSPSAESSPQDGIPRGPPSQAGEGASGANSVLVKDDDIKDV